MDCVIEDCPKGYGSVNWIEGKPPSDNPYRPLYCPISGSAYCKDCGVPARASKKGIEEFGDLPGEE